MNYGQHLFNFNPGLTNTQVAEIRAIQGTMQWPPSIQSIEGRHYTNLYNLRMHLIHNRGRNLPTLESTRRKQLVIPEVAHLRMLEFLKWHRLFPQHIGAVPSIHGDNRCHNL